jgi:hypothetical protein
MTARTQAGNVQTHERADLLPGQHRRTGGAGREALGLDVQVRNFVYFVYFVYFVGAM